MCILVEGGETYVNIFVWMKDDPHPIWRGKEYNNNRCGTGHGCTSQEELFCLYSSAFPRPYIWDQR